MAKAVDAPPLANYTSSADAATHRLSSEVGQAASSLLCVLQVGLDAAGKTTILYKLKLGEIVTTIPTIGESPAHPSCTQFEIRLACRLAVHF